MTATPPAKTRRHTSKGEAVEGAVVGLSIAQESGRHVDGKQSGASLEANGLAHDYTINDNDYRRPRPLDDGVDAPYLEEELKVRYTVEFVRTPVNERIVFSNATYLGETKIRNYKRGYAQLNHVWLVDYHRVNHVNLDSSLHGLLLISSKRWRFGCLPDPSKAFVGLCAVRADKRRDIIAIETRLEDAL